MGGDVVTVEGDGQEEFQRLMARAEELAAEGKDIEAKVVARKAMEYDEKRASKFIKMKGLSYKELMAIESMGKVASAKDYADAIARFDEATAAGDDDNSEIQLWMYNDADGKEWGPLTTNEMQQGVVLGHISEGTMTNKHGGDEADIKPFGKWDELQIDDETRKKHKFEDLIDSNNLKLGRRGMDVKAIADAAQEAIDLEPDKPQGWLLLADCHSFCGIAKKACDCYLQAMFRAPAGSFAFCKSAYQAYELCTDPTIEDRPADLVLPQWMAEPELLYYIATQIIAVMGEHRQPGAWRMKADALRLMGKEREANSAYERARYVLAKRIRELEGLTLPKPEDDEEITVTGADGDEEKEPADYGSAVAALEKALGMWTGLVADASGEKPMLPLTNWAPPALPPLGIGACNGRWAGGVCSVKDRQCIQDAMGDALGKVPFSRYTPHEIAEMGALTSAQDACVRHGGFVVGAELFDNTMFSLSPAESATMDPQQRLLLEHGFTALHAASWQKVTLSGGDTGVFLGIERPDWALAQPPEARGSVYAVTGDNVSAAAGRISFSLGLQGPCNTIDTACASALVALNACCNAVRNGDCGASPTSNDQSRSAGLACAVSLKLVPHGTIGAASAGMLSVDGRCKTLDNSANGYMRSEAVGAIVMRYHNDSTGAAQAPLEPVVASTKCRQDGRSASLTAPNGSAQRQLHTQTLKTGSISPNDVGFMELHGTGTPLGDPTETGALGTVYSTPFDPNEEPRRSPLVVMAAKASVGHSEAPSGSVGFLKMYFSLLGQFVMPGNTKLRHMNPLIEESLSRASQKSKCTTGAFLFSTPIQSLFYPLVTPSSTMTGGVSSFGFSGTIAHCLMRHCAAEEPNRGQKFALHRLEKRFLHQWAMPAWGTVA